MNLCFILKYVNFTFKEHITFKISRDNMKVYLKLIIFSFSNFFSRMKCPVQFKFEKVEPEVLDSTKDDKVAAEYDEDFLDFYSATEHDVFGPSLAPKVSKSDPKVIKQKRKIDEVKDSQTQKHESTVTTDTETRSEDTSSTVTDNSIDKGCEEKQNTKIDSANAKEKTPNVLETADASSVLDNLLNMQDNLLKSTPSVSPQKQVQEENKPRLKKQWPWSNTLETSWEKHTDVS